MSIPPIGTSPTWGASYPQVDPALEQALQQAQAWAQSIPSSDSAGQALAANLISHIQTFINHGSSMADLVNFISGPGGYGKSDVFMLFPGATTQDAEMVYQIVPGATGNTSPTDIDGWYYQVWATLYGQGAHPSAADTALFNPLLDYMKNNVGSASTAECKAQWVNFASYMLISNQGLFQAVENEPNSPLGIFLNATFTQSIASLMNFKILEDKSSPAPSPGQNLFNLILAQITPYATNPPPPLNRQATWALNEFIQQLTQGGGKNDIYLQFPGLTTLDAQNLWSSFNLGTPPQMTAMDLQADLVYNTWINGIPPLQPGTADYQLAENLLTEMQTLGSNAPTGPGSSLQSWAQAIVNGGFIGYPGLTGQGMATFETLTGAVPYSVQIALQQALTWQSTLQPGSPAFQLASAFIAEIQNLINNHGGLADLQAWVSSTYINSNDDAYLQFPGLQVGALQTLYNFAHLNVQDPGPTSMDLRCANLALWEQRNAPGDPLVQDLINLMMQSGSKMSDSTFKSIAENWLNNMVKSRNPDYMNASRAVKAEIASIIVNA